MSLCDCRGLLANDKEVARRRSVSREPQALLVCESLIQRRAASRGSDEVIHKKHRQACRRINQWFLKHHADNLNDYYASDCGTDKGNKKVAAPLQGMRLLSR